MIPGDAKLCGTVRAFSDEVRALIRERMRAICAGIGGCVPGRDHGRYPRHLQRAGQPGGTIGVVAEVARTVVDPAKVITRTQPKMGSEDFADMLQAVPGAYFWVGHDGSVPVHNPGYMLDDKILPIGASMFARIIENPFAGGRPCINQSTEETVTSLHDLSAVDLIAGFRGQAVLAVRSAGGRAGACRAMGAAHQGAVCVRSRRRARGRKGIDRTLAERRADRFARRRPRHHQGQYRHQGRAGAAGGGQPSSWCRRRPMHRPRRGCAKPVR